MERYNFKNLHEIYIIRYIHTKKPVTVVIYSSEWIGIEFYEIADCLLHTTLVFKIYWYERLQISNLLIPLFRIAA